MDILDKYTDAELLAQPFGLTKTQVHKLRKGMMVLSDIDPQMEHRLLEHYSEVGTEAGRPDPSNPDYSHPGFAPYDIYFRESVRDLGLEMAFNQAMTGHACGCMGPQEGDPFCPCQMRQLIAMKYATRTVTPTQAGEELLSCL